MSANYFRAESWLCGRLEVALPWHELGESGSGLLISCLHVGLQEAVVLNYKASVREGFKICYTDHVPSCRPGRNSTVDSL